MKITPVELIDEKVKIQSMEEIHVPELFEAGYYREIWPYMPL